MIMKYNKAINNDNNPLLLAVNIRAKRNKICAIKNLFFFNVV